MVRTCCIRRLKAVRKHVPVWCNTYDSDKSNVIAIVSLLNDEAFGMAFAERKESSFECIRDKN